MRQPVILPPEAGCVNPMARQGIKSLVCSCLGAVTAFCAGPRGFAESFEVRADKPFPQIALPLLNGGTASIDDFRGKKIILHVFASW